MEETNMGKIKIQGRASKLVECDVVEFMITIHATDSSLSKAISKVREDTEKLLKSLNEMGFEMKDIHLDDDSTNKEYGKDKSSYYCDKEISFTAQCNAALNNEVLSLIKDKKITAHMSTRYNYSKEKELRKELLKESLLDSKAKAQLLAETSNQAIIGVDEIKDKDIAEYEEMMFREVVCRKKSDYLSDSLGASLINIEESIVVSWNIE